jgi:hypothetical protein
MWANGRVPAVTGLVYLFWQFLEAGPSGVKLTRTGAFLLVAR